MDDVEFIKNNYGILDNDAISNRIGIPIWKVRRLGYKHIPFESRYRRGKSPHCRVKRKYNLNDDSFALYTPGSCYWAGMMAADGNIRSGKPNTFSIGLKESDKEHVEKFKKWLEFEGPVSYNTSRYFYQGELQIKHSYSICATSLRVVHDLGTNFGITSQKSLTITPPIHIGDNNHIDAFIKGYIDGDGCIGTGRKNTTRLSIIGTREMVDWINHRFECIIGKSLPAPRKKQNVWVIDFRNKTSRTILKHLFSIDTPRLERKWNSQIRDIVFDYKKSRNFENYRRIFGLINSGDTKTMVAKKLNVSPSAISWITKQEYYKSLVRESADRDKGEVDMEEES